MRNLDLSTNLSQKRKKHHQHETYCSDYRACILLPFI